jgi:catechol 2,3-dioxygenase-like lactoylglutathione lyase family enzyme
VSPQLSTGPLPVLWFSPYRSGRERTKERSSPRQGGLITRHDGLVLRIGAVVVGVSDVPRAVGFWTGALGLVLRGDGAPDDDFVVLVPLDGQGSGLALMASATPVQDHPRIHLDLYAGDAADQAAEVERLVGLGATRVDWDLYPDDPDFVVLADPDGNRFCVIDTSR